MASPVMDVPSSPDMNSLHMSDGIDGILVDASNMPSSAIDISHTDGHVDISSDVVVENSFVPTAGLNSIVDNDVVPDGSLIQ